MPKPTLVDDQKTVYNNDTTPKAVTVSWQTGDVIVWTGQLENSDGGTLTPTATGLSFTEQQVVDVTSYGYVRVMTAVAASSGSSVSVSTAKSGGTATLHWGASVKVWRGSDGVGASSKTNVASGAPTLDITTTQINSAIQLATNDWNAVDGSSRTWRTNAGALTETNYYSDPGVTYTTYAGYHADAGSVGTYAVGLYAPGGQKYSIIALEIKGTTGGGTVHDVSISETANATDALDQGAPFDGDVFDFDVFDVDPTGGGGTTYTRDVAETASATDSVSALGQLVAAVSDAGSAVDTVSALGVFLGAIAEAGSAAESTSALGQFVAALTEAASAVDAPSALVAAVASVSDSGSASEQVSSGSGPSIYNVSVDETAAATEAVSALGVLLAALAESGSTNDSVSGALNALAQAIEAGDAQDVVTSGAALLAALGETGAASDVLAAPPPPTGDTAPQGSLLVDPGRLLNR